jgi:leucyl aminopeptidase (aminopeptidase T)
MKASEAARNSLENVLEAVTGESVIIVCDEEKREVGEAFAEGALTLGLWTRLMILKTGKEMRKDISPYLLEVLAHEKSDIYINLMRGLREETPFRINVIKLETRGRRARLGHCPGVTIDMLTEGALALTVEEHKKMQSFAEKLMRALEGTVEIDLRNPHGTNLKLSTQQRPFFTDTKLDWKTMKWMNLPTGEVIAAPVENSLSGRLVCDVAIGGIGPIKSPVEIEVENGTVTKVTSKNKVMLRKVNETLATDGWSNTVGEFAFGINPKARLMEEFLETEKILGTVHIAFGNNIDYPGGKNPSQNHMDFLMSKPTVKAVKENGKTLTILDNGSFKI